MPKYCPSCARIESNGEYCPSCGTKLVNQDAIGSSYVKNEINPDYRVISGRIEHLSIKYHTDFHEHSNYTYTTIGVHHKFWGKQNAERLPFKFFRHIIKKITTQK